jgi:predicted membrane protein
MGEESFILWSVLFSGIGLGFFSFGRKQKAIIPFISGVLLMAMPYFLASVTSLFIAAIILMAIPYFIRL